MSETGLPPEPKRYCCITGAMGETFDPRDRTKPKGDYVLSSDYDALRAAYEKAISEGRELAARLDKIERVSMTGSVQNWLKLPDDQKAETFALLVEQSSLHKKARERAEAAEERERAAREVVEAAKMLSMSLDGGFVRCERCGDQEDTTDLDFAPQLREALKEYAALRAGERT